MTALLTPARPTTPGSRDRPLALHAALAGLIAAGSVLAGCAALALAGWFASDAGSHGDTTDALRVAADGWLLAHGAHLSLGEAGITVVPLGLTLTSGYVAYRLGRRAAVRSAVEETGPALLGSVVLAGVYGVFAVVVAVLASLPSAQPDLGLAFVGGFVVAFLGGGAGIVCGAGLPAAWRPRVPDAVVAVGAGALAGVLLMFAAGSVLLASALLLDLGSAANVLARLHTDVPGGLLYTVLVAAVAPNAVLLTGAYLLGPGFAVGTGTVVSPSAVVLGPLPSFPLLAALPDADTTPWWTSLLVGVPVAVAALAAWLMLRRHPVAGYEAGAVRGLAAGALAAVLLTALVLAAGGSAGPGRMAHIGAPGLPTLGAAAVAMAAGGLVGGVIATWWQRRRALHAASSTAGTA